MTAFDRDTLMKRALMPHETIHAPADLGDDIIRAVLTTPQRRRRFTVPPLGWPRQHSPVSVVLLLTMLLVLLLGALVVLSRLSAPAARLTMYHGGPERSGVMPGPGPEGDPIVVWDAQRNGALGVTIMPIVAEGQVFVVDDSGTVAALDETHGQLLWEYSVGSPIRASPVWVDGLVVVGSDSGDVVAVRATDGTEAWRFVASGPVSASLTVVEQTVYVGSEDEYLYALEAASGRLQWSTPVGGPVTRGPAISNGVIYVGARGGRFSAVDTASRETLWSVELGDGDVGTPAVVDGIVYVGRGIEATTTSPQDLVALAATDGSWLWSFAPISGQQVHLGAVGDDLVYAVSEDNSVYALDPATGAVTWSHPTDGRIGSLAALVGGVLYVSSTDGTVRAVDAATGNFHWSVAVDGEPAMPAVINGRVFVGTTMGRVYAIGGTEAAP